MAQKLVLRAEMYARALRASQKRKEDRKEQEGVRLRLVCKAWASAGVEGTRMGVL